ncbi:MAG: hypothetical protein ACP5KN_08195 [Armatimonadota bacterium]
MTRRLLLMVAVVGLVLSAGPVLAWTGTLTTRTGGLVYGDDWQPASLTWDVTQDATNSNVYHYEYTLNVSEVATGGNISHMIIELTDDDYYNNFTYPSMDLFNLQRWDGTEWVDWAPTLTVDDHLAGSAGNPDLTSDVFGVKFDDSDGGEWGEWDLLQWRFDAYRLPVWGDFYAKDGKLDQVDKTLYNAGLDLPDPTDPPQDGSIDNHILRPNGRTPQLPPSALLGLSMFPLGIAYLRGRRRDD